MYDIKWVRENPEAFDSGLARRGLAPCSEQALALDGQRREAQARAQEMQQRRNAASKEIGQAMGAGERERAEALKAEVATIKESLPRLEKEANEAGAALTQLLEGLPNRPDDSVPDGPDEESNEELRRWGTPPAFDFPVKQHFELAAAGAGRMDFELAAKLSGARFVVLSGEMARLHRALAQFMLDLHVEEHGYLEVNPPALVRDQALYGTGQLPKFAEDLYRTTDDFWLIPTAEVPLTNFAAERIFDEEALPQRLTAHTLCFRSEAGSAGRDVRGMLRQHQFEKVELVSITLPEQSEAEHERMTACAETVLQRLGLPYRVMLLSAGDMGFGARKTYDLEVWLPGQDSYREISSCSNCGGFQALRMRGRYRPKGGKGTVEVHTLNGSGVAVGRAMIAVLENYQQADGSVVVPEALRPYMRGQEVIRG